MKIAKIGLIVGSLILMFACGSTKNMQKNSGNVQLKAAEDSVEYELVIFDNGFDTWLMTNARPMNFYSQEYYENWNQQYVSEWNHRYTTGVNPDLYESYVDYNPAVEYGLELNYKLYNYFLYFEESNGVTLVQRRGK